MKKILLFIILLMGTLLSFGQGPGCQLDEFVDDVKADPELSNAVKENPALVDNWQLLDDADVDESVRRNIDAVSDPDATVDAIQTSEKIKPTWAEIVVLWKRGNDFNAKVRKEVPNRFLYYEVTVKKTLSNGKVRRYRLDSYNPGSDIISRKATDFDKIQTSTFQNYISELKNKYQVGLEIIKPGTPINGQVLQGTYKLEVPKSNLNSTKLAEFQQIANDNGVELVFTDEF